MPTGGKVTDMYRVKYEGHPGILDNKTSNR